MEKITNHYKIERVLNDFVKKPLESAYQFDYKGISFLTFKTYSGWNVIEKWTSLKAEPRNVSLRTRQIAVEEAKKLMDRNEEHLPAILAEIENKKQRFIDLKFNEFVEV